MIVTVASGKGGTGKTTVAVNLAVTAAEAIRATQLVIAPENPENFVELIDCDVEEPNAHLFVKPQNVVKQEISTMVPAVDMALCTLCEECEKICRFSAITMIAKKIMIFPEMCHSCKGCSMVCPTGAIKESSRVLGSLLTGQSSHGFNLTWGELRVGEAMSPPLIKQVKKTITCRSGRGNSISEDINNKLSIVDAPPGTSCPAVTTLRSSDFALLVAEETPFGLNDLALTVEALKKLGVPMGIVINRADSEQKGIIDDYAEKENIEIMQRVPFSREAAKICSKGLLLVNELPEMKQCFKELYLKIVSRITQNAKESKYKKTFTKTATSSSDNSIVGRS
ncbi:MAG: ATP-binding protein [Desulfamplus sp.]|nr:ATP-binding protein [Desulfamplus sp.]